MKTFLFAGLVAAAACSHATMLTLTATADDFMDAYISTDDSVQGTQFLNKTSLWGTIDVVSVALTAGVDNYLHIRARDAFGQPSMIIGQVQLSDADFTTPNGTQYEVTNVQNWKLSRTGFGVNDLTPVDLGLRGTNAWGVGAPLDANAHHIWSDQTAGEHYFSLKLTSAVPEPGSVIALVAGASALILRRRAR